MLKIGFISYLNAFPYYFPFLKEAHSDWQFVIERPGVLNSMIHRGALDISLVSFMEYAANPDLYLLAPNIGLSSKGYVDSVRLLSQVPITDLGGSHIFTTSASATSVAVMEILLHEVGVKDYKCDTYDVEKGIPIGAAALTIGDEALTEVSHYKYSYDLGEMWQQKFSRNVVFASCAILRETAEQKPQAVSDFIRRLEAAPEVSFCDRGLLERACKVHYPTISAPMDYLDRLHYVLGDQERQDIKFFLSKAFEYGLLPNNVSPQYFTILPELAQRGNA